MGNTIGVVGGGAWGTSLAQVQALSGRDVTLWAREPEVVQAVNATHENAVYLKSIPLHENLKATSDLADLAKSDVILMVAPAQYVRCAFRDLKPHLRADQPVVICAKGIEIETGELLTTVAKDELGADHPVGVLSGPNFAAEIARGLPAAVTIAAEDEALRDRLKISVGAKYFRPYVSGDVVGAQIGGAMKNVIAIAAGIASGRELGESARSALITRGLTEMARLCQAMGGRSETLMDMCGVGDLMLTCSSMQSRNCSLGVRLGQGESLEAILDSRNSVTEGVYTARAAVKLADRYGVELPVTSAVNLMLEGVVSVGEAIDMLLSRPFAA